MDTDIVNLVLSSDIIVTVLILFVSLFAFIVFAHLLDFFKYHWNTLKSVSGLPKALINSDAEWKDGKYSIKMEAEDITGNKTIKEEIKILNNFRPYAEKITIKDLETQETYYEAEWALKKEVLTLKKATNQSFQVNKTYKHKVLFIVNIGTSKESLDYLLDTLLETCDLLAKSKINRHQTLANKEVVLMPQKRTYHSQKSGNR